MDIHKISPEQIGQAASFAWELFSSVENRSYPLYKTEEELFCELTRRSREQNSRLLACSRDGRLSGIMACYSIPSERYLQTVAICADPGSDGAIDEFLNYLEREYRHYTAYIGIEKGNLRLKHALQAHGYVLIEDSADMRMKVADYHGFPAGAAVERITQRTLPGYLQYHEAHFNSGYWNAERIAEDFDRWDIFGAYEKGRIAGGLFLICNREKSLAEIYGLKAADRKMTLELLNFAVQHIQAARPDVRDIMFMVEGSETDNYVAALAVGFTVKSRYCCWRREFE